MQKNYDFRQELLQIHRPNILNKDYRPDPNMLCISEDFSIVFLQDCGEVILTAVKDLQDYLFTSLGLSVALRPIAAPDAAPESSILVATAAALGISFPGENIPASYHILVTEAGVTICGIDDRGCAQGCYALEDRMNRIRAPYLTHSSENFSPAFSPRMIHSGYGQDQYPDAHLSAIAHAGMDAILVFVKDTDLTPTGYLDFNGLIRQAAKYGLDVYAYSKLKSDMHPAESGALAYYNGTYGKLFAQCPGFKGVVLVGESVEFPSKDPRVSPLRYYNNTVDGLPTGKVTAGWFPCYDYPQWLEMLQQVIYPHNPDADIVLWSYNWGRCAEAERLALIDTLPKGISLMATFEMFQVKQMEGFRAKAVDYTISFPEPGPYFLSEARRAKERGVRLYSQANSAGRSWDYGVIPYDPFPYHWVRRYNAMLKAKKEFGLCGIMESHHYGFWPSFISKIEKQMFTVPATTGTDALRLAAEELYGQENADAALAAWKLLSDAHTFYPCTNEDQYGPFRIGPAYPFILEAMVKIPTVPNAPFGGNTITYPDYAFSNGKCTYSIQPPVLATGFRQVRVDAEIRSLEKMRALQQQARGLLEEIAQRLTGIQKADCLRLCNMLRFMENTATTTIHAKQWAKLRWQFYSLTDPEELRHWVQKMQILANNELQNAEETIPVVEADSRLGWEPSMEYIGDARHIRWKIKQLTMVLEIELPRYLEVIDNL